jgi:acetaldehyde dehydrogenase/alcohol dehydrogenase
LSYCAACKPVCYAQLLHQVYDEVKAEFIKRGAYIMTPQQCQQASSTIIKDGRLNADVVGKKPSHLAALFGFSVPAGKLLAASFQAVDGLRSC